MFIINENDDKVDYTITGLDLPTSSLPSGMSGALINEQYMQIPMAGSEGTIAATVSGVTTSVAAVPSGSYAVDSAGVVASTTITPPSNYCHYDWVESDSKWVISDASVCAEPLVCRTEEDIASINGSGQPGQRISSPCI